MSAPTGIGPIHFTLLIMHITENTCRVQFNLRKNISNFYSNTDQVKYIFYLLHFMEYFRYIAKIIIKQLYIKSTPVFCNTNCKKNSWNAVPTAFLKVLQQSSNCPFQIHYNIYQTGINMATIVVVFIILRLYLIYTPCHTYIIFVVFTYLYIC